MKPKATQPKLNLKPKATTRAITISLKFTTIARLDQLVEKGSWSILIDQAVNTRLDEVERNHQ